MTSVRLQCVEDLSTGMHGLIVKGMVLYDFPMVAHDGRVIAHDLIEHQNGIHNIKSIGDELEAIGGIWHTRGQWGDISRDPINYFSPEESISHDIYNLAALYITRVKSFNWPIHKTRPHSWDDSFYSILEIAKPKILEQIESGDLEGYEIETELVRERYISRMNIFFNDAIHYMRTGIRKAEKRFGKGPKANTLFWNIAEAVEPFAKYCEYEGQEYILTYSWNEANCREVYESDYY